MEIDIRIGSARLVLDPPMMTATGGVREVSPSTTVADITKVVVAACRALGTDEAADLALHMRGEAS
jgi:hypothetical protein